MLRAERQGWVLELAAIGLDGSSTPADFSKLTDAGLGVMVRINNGYGSAGTLPLPDKYPDFAAACATYVQRSKGCHIWIIGNEPNHRDEQPEGRPIFPNDYACAYDLCRTAIRALPGHETDQVLVAGPSPWNATTTYAGNEKGDWVRYFVHVLTMLDDDACDGFALHSYTHSLDPRQITGDYFHTTQGYRHLRNEFRSYLDFMNAIPDRFRHLAVFITETDPTTLWHRLESRSQCRLGASCLSRNRNMEQQARASADFGAAPLSLAPRARSTRVVNFQSWGDCRGL